MKMIRLLYFVMLVAYAISSQGQSIVNTEKMLPTLNNPKVLQVKLGGNLSGGNVEVSQLKASVNAGMIQGKNTFRVMGGTGLLISQGVLVKNNAFGQLRHNAALTEKIKTFGFYQLQSNNVLLLLRRQLAGGGIRMDLLRSKADSVGNRTFSMSVMIGAMYEEELLDQDKVETGVAFHEEALRMTNSLGFSYQISPTAKLVSTTYYQPDLEAFDDFRLLTDADLQVKISKHFAVSINGEYRYDSHPPLPLKQSDYQLSAGLDITF